MSIACAKAKQRGGMTPAFPIARWLGASVVAALLFVCASPAIAQTPPAPPADTTALGKEQQNPISSMPTIPWQFNFNSGGGLEDGTFLLLNVQPVMPFKVSDRLEHGRAHDRAGRQRARSGHDPVQRDR